MTTAAFALLIGGAGGPGGIASAADRVPLGGGAGISINGDTFCTLTTIGTDGAGDLVGFTSARCGTPGAAVTVQGAGKVGDVVATNNELDYAVIKFDPARVNPISNFRGFAINGISGDAGQGQVACRLSRGSGHTCFTLTGQALAIAPPVGAGPSVGAPGVITAFSTAGSPDGAFWQPDDGGGPVTVNDQLIGMVGDSFNIWPPVRQHRITVVTITPILDDANARGGPGAGFAPVQP